MIDFGKPFVGGWQCLTTRLFAPFDFSKWLTVAFTAFLAGFLNGSSGGSFNWGNHSVSSETMSNTGDQVTHWLSEWQNWSWIAVLISLAVLGFWILLIWLGSRGQFMFLDNVVGNRGLVIAPWQEFRELGNRLFGFYLAVGLASILLLLLEVVLIVGFLWTDYQAGRLKEFSTYVPALVLAIVFGLSWIPIALYFFLYLEMGIPIMYRQGCGPVAAAGKLFQLIRARWTDLLVYCLIRFGMAVLLLAAFFIVGLFTCCMGFILLAMPYISTVLTLPIAVFLQGFTLDCLAQFGPEYDAWNRAQTPKLPNTSLL